MKRTFQVTDVYEVNVDLDGLVSKELLKEVMNRATRTMTAKRTVKEIATGCYADEVEYDAIEQRIYVDLFSND